MDELRDDFIFSPGDTITVQFSTSTNTPFGLGILNKVKVDEIFTFLPETPQIFANRDWTYEGQWENPSRFKITILTVNSDPDDNPLIGIERIQVNDGANLTDKDGTTPPSTSLSEPLSGSFAPFSALRHVLAGGTAVFTLPQGIFLEVTIPVEDNIGIETITDPTPGFTFLGNSLEITSFEEDTCESGCDISFTFSADDLVENNLSLDIIRILHDANNDGKFLDTVAGKEILVPEIEPPEAPGPFTATATVFSLSEVGIGAPVKSGGGGGGDEIPPTFNSFEAITCTPEIGCGVHIAKEVTYLNDMPTAKLPVGHTSVLTLNMYENSGPTAIQHVTMYLNLHGYGQYIQDSDTYVRFQKGQPIIVKDPHGFLSDAKITIIPRGADVSANFYLTFEKPMDVTDVIIRAWDSSRNSRDATFKNAITAVSMNLPDDQTRILASPETQVPAESSGVISIPQDIISQWAGYSTKFVTDNELLDQLGIEGNKIPTWYKKQVADWVYDRTITQEEFVNALKFFEKGGMLT